MKYLSPGEAETKRQKAVEFLHRIGNDDLAEEFEAMDAREYAEHKGAALIENSERRNSGMPRKTIDDYKDENADLKDQLGDLEEENQALQDKLNDIVGIASGDEDEDEDEDADDDNGDDDNGNDGPE